VVYDDLSLGHRCEGVALSSHLLDQRALKGSVTIAFGLTLNPNQWWRDLKGWDPATRQSLRAADRFAKKKPRETESMRATPICSGCLQPL
jgi:hypothetical protein